MPTLVFYVLVSFGASVALTPAFRLLSQRLGQVARPKEDRWHRQSTALFGGLAIAIVTIATGLTIPDLGQVRTLIACSALVAVFGFVDDMLSLKPSTKLVAQITVASILLFFGFRLHWMQSLLGDAMLTLFWIVGVTNAFNLLDNMDGLCAGTTIIAGGFMLLGVVNGAGVTPAALYLAALVGATAGISRLQPPPRVDLHGRHGQPVPGVESRRDGARRTSRRSDRRPAFCRSLPVRSCRCSCRSSTRRS